MGGAQLTQLCHVLLLRQTPSIKTGQLEQPWPTTSLTECYPAKQWHKTSGQEPSGNLQDLSSTLGAQKIYPKLIYGTPTMNSIMGEYFVLHIVSEVDSTISEARKASRLKWATPRMVHGQRLLRASFVNQARTSPQNWARCTWASQGLDGSWILNAPLGMALAASCNTSEQVSTLALNFCGCHLWKPSSLAIAGVQLCHLKPLVPRILATINACPGACCTVPQHPGAPVDNCPGIQFKRENSVWDSASKPAQHA